MTAIGSTFSNVYKRHVSPLISARSTPPVSSTVFPHRDALGVDIQPGVWHSMAVLTDHVVCFEVKPGPYSAARDKGFAPWAPREGDPTAGAYLDMLACSVKPPTL